MKKTFLILSILFGILESSYGTVQSIEKIASPKKWIELQGRVEEVNPRSSASVEAYIENDILTVCFNVPFYGNTLTVSIDDEQGKVIFEQDFIVFEPNVVHIQVNRNEIRTYTLHITNPEFCDLYGDF